MALPHALRVELGLVWLISGPKFEPFQDSWFISFLWVRGIVLGAADSPGLGCTQHPGPSPASQPQSCTLPLQAHGRCPILRVQVRGPLSIAHSPGPQEPRQVFYHVFDLSSLSGHHFHPRWWDGALSVLRGRRSRFAGDPGAVGLPGGMMGGGAAAHAKMHQPVFFWWWLKVVCAVPGMTQCSWRRCTSGLWAHAWLWARNRVILVILKHLLP